MIKFSLILPTRNRIPLLLKMLASIETAEDISCVETLVIHDDDDSESKEILENLQKPWIKILSRPRGNNVSRDYYNWALQFVTGELIWAINDDAEIETSGWDKLIYEKMKDCEIALGSVWCDHYDYEGQSAPFSYFPILPRISTEKLGYILPSYYAGWGADCILSEIFQRVGKIIKIDEVRVRHITGKKLQDDCFKHMEQITPGTDGTFNQQDEVNKLTAYLEEKNRIKMLAESTSPENIEHTQ